MNSPPNWTKEKEQFGGLFCRTFLPKGPFIVRTAPSEYGAAGAGENVSLPHLNGRE